MNRRTKARIIANIIFTFGVFLMMMFVEVLWTIAVSIGQTTTVPETLFVGGVAFIILSVKPIGFKIMNAALADLERTRR